MRTFVVLFAVFAVWLDVSGQTPVRKPPHRVITQREVSQNIFEQYKKSDLQLKKLYNGVLDQIRTFGSDTETQPLVDEVVNAHQKWIAYRDNHCKVYENLYESGSLNSSMLTQCKHELTKNRIRELKTLLKDLSL